MFSNNITKESRDTTAGLNATILTCEDLCKLGQESNLIVDEIIDKSEDLEHISVVM